MITQNQAKHGDGGGFSVFGSIHRTCTNHASGRHVAVLTEREAVVQRGEKDATWRKERGLDTAT